MNAGEKPVREWHAMIKLALPKPAGNSPPLKVECRIMKERKNHVRKTNS